MLRKKYLRAVLISLGIAILLECTLFNYHSLSTIFSGYDSTTLSFNSYLFSKHSVVIRNVDQDVATLYLEPQFSTSNSRQNLTVTYTDSAGTWELPLHRLIPSLEMSRFIRIPAMGSVSEIKITFDNPVTDGSFSFIELNRPYPFVLRPVRLLLLSFVFFLIWCLRNTSLPKISVRKSQKQLWAWLGLSAVLAGFSAFTVFTSVNPGAPLSFIMPQDSSTAYIYKANQLNTYLPEAFLNGQTHFTVDPPDSILEMDDPYNQVLRERKGIDKSFLWDTVLFEGKYYSYFGVVPVLLVFLPFRAVTGRYLHAFPAVFLFSAAALIALLWLWRLIVRRYFAKLPFVLSLLGGLSFAACSLILYLNRSPQFYEVSSLSGLFFGALAFALLLSSTEKEKLSLPKLMFSCLCFALAVGCKANMIFLSALVPLYLFPYIKNLWQEKKHFFLAAAAVFVPYAAVAVPMMWYNYVRFGSVLEFGYSYMLTTSNVGVYNQLNPTQWLDKLFAGLYSFLFYPVEFQSLFPFLKAWEPASLPFNGYIYIQPMVGLFCFPLIWGLFGLPFSAKRMRRSQPELFRLLITLLTLGVFLLGANAMTAGLTTRYSVDFAWLFALAALLILFFLYLRCREKGKTLRRGVPVILVLLMVSSVAFMFFLSFTGDYNWMLQRQVKIFIDLRYTFSVAW